MWDKLHRALIERRAAMTLAVFDSPPADWAGFQKRLGQYIELDTLIREVEQIMSGKEHDE